MFESSREQVRDLRARLDGLTIRDAARLGRRLKHLRHATTDEVARLAEQFAAAEALVGTRAQLDRLLPRGSPPPARAAAAEVRDIASPIEELRVSLWAQQLGTPRPLVAELPPRECDILTMRFFGSQTQTQIAQKLGISQMHVSRLLARSLAQLRAGLAA